MKKQQDEIKAWMNILDKISNTQKELNEKIEKEIDMPELEEEEIEYTCCGDEVTGWVEDYRICPTCKEHI